MAFNAKVMHWVLREKWKCEKMPHEVIINKKGQRHNKYNYYSGLTKRIFDYVKADLTKSKISEGQIPVIMSRSGLSIASIQRKLEGIEETHLYEIEELLNTVNYSVRFSGSDNEVFRIVKTSPNYSYKQELNRIIVKRNLYPKFYINFNPDKPIDFELNFSEEKILFKITEGRIISLAMEAISTFFDDKKKPIKGIQSKIKTEIRRQFLNGEIIIHNKK